MRPEKEMPSGPAGHSKQQMDHRTAGQSIAQVVDPSMVYGATATEWNHVDLILGLTADIVPIVSNPNREISPDSKLEKDKLGKVPSYIGRDGKVIGYGKWTDRESTTANVTRWAKEPDHGIGLQCRRVRAIDVDIDDADLARKIREAIVGKLGYVPPVRGRTDSSKFLMPFLVEHEEHMPKVVIRTGRGNIELLADGQQFVFAGMHPKGCRYTWEGGLPEEIPELSLEQWEALRQMLREGFGTGEIEAKRGRKGSGNGQDPECDRIGDFLDENGWTLADGGDGRRHIRCPFEDGHSMGQAGDGSTTYFPPDKEFAEGHFKCLHGSCAGRSDGDFLEAIGYGQDMFKALALPAGADQEPTLPSFQRAKNGSIEATKANVVKALQAPQVAGYVLRFDEFEGDVVLAPSDDPQAWRHLSDTHYTEIRLNLEKVGFREIGKDSVRDCIDFVAEQARFDTAQAWLGTLAWDGVPRVERFLADYLGTENTEYTRAVSRYIWTALAGRVLVPGVKADMAPVLVGAQGVRKSTAVAAMAPSPNFFLELDLGKKDDDISRLLRGKLVIELGELRGLRSKEMEHLKSFLARQHEKFIEKFKVRETCYPRRGLFIGTTNRDDFLTDETGNRRWLPFRVGRCDPDGIAAVRNQLWAEGAVLFQAKGVDIAAERLAGGELTEFTEQDSWDVLIERWLDEPMAPDGSGRPRERQHLTSADILRECLGFVNRDITRAGEMRVAAVMRRLEYQQKTRTVGDHTGQRARHRVWVVG